MPNEQYRRGGYLPPKEAKVTGGKEFFDLLDNLIPTTKEKTEAVVAGMPPIEQALHKNVPELDHSQAKWADKLYGKERKHKHIRDAITYKPGETITGGTNIGFTGDAAPIARWVNWGTYRQEPQFFMEKTFRNDINFEEVFRLQEAKLKAIRAKKDSGVQH